MQNLRYKLLFVTCALVAGVQTSLDAANASEHYTFYIREFLRNLGVRNPATVPVRKISRNDPLYTAAGYSDGTAIHLNEDKFVNHSEASNLFTCAHESAHHALRHAYRDQSGGRVLAMEQEADEYAARMLCTHGYRWVVEEEARSGRMEDGVHPANQQRRVYLSRILETNGEYNQGPERDNPVPERNVGRGRGNAGRQQNGQRTGRGRSNAGRQQNGQRTGRAGSNSGRQQNGQRTGRDNNQTQPDQSRAGREDNQYRERKKPMGEGLKDLLNQFNDLSREQKMVIAGILAATLMGWV